MACGTPVVAFRRGSMPELIDDGVSGFLVDTVDEAVAAVPAAASLERAPIRSVAVARFGRERMIGDYLRAYARLLDPAGPAPQHRNGARPQEAVVPLH
jgi:glycosyltransferase involved in cell wall biosynthesis